MTVIEPMIGGGGGRPGSTAIDGCDASLGFLKTTPAETLEAEVPAILIRRFHLVADSAGPGRWRGGIAVRLDLQVFRPEGQVTARGMERLRFAPWGVAGGTRRRHGPRRARIPGTPRERAVPKIDLLGARARRRAERAHARRRRARRSPGSSGRPTAVAADVEAGLVTPAHAREAYGVAMAGGASTRRRRRAAGGAPRRRRPAGPFDFGAGPRRPRAALAARLQDALVALLMSCPRPTGPTSAGRSIRGSRRGRTTAGDDGRSDASLDGARRVVRPVGGPGKEPVENLAGKVAVVTGAASGIGLALAERFAAEGMKVVMADIEAGPPRDGVGGGAAEGGRGPGSRGSTSPSPDDVERLARETYARLRRRPRALQQRGRGGDRRSHEHTLADWQWVINVNLWGVIHGVRAFLPRMLAGGDEGHIVNTASMAGLTTSAFMSVYDVTKHGVVALSESMYKEFTVTGAPIGVSVVCPGLINTNIMRSSRNRPESLAEEGKAGAMAQAFGQALCATGSPAAIRPRRWPSRSSPASARDASTSCPRSPR